MNRVALVTAFAVVVYCSLTDVTFAKGSGGGHGSGGHGSAGHASGGHGSGGHGGGRSHGTAVARSGKVTSRTESPTGLLSARRPTDGQVVTGIAVPRSPVTFPSVATLKYSPLRFRSYAGIGLGFGGLGFWYDPFWPGYGYGSFGYSSFGYPYGSSLSRDAGFGYAPYPFDDFGPTGSLRLRVEPREAAVYVDGYYAGIVDDFDGHFQHLDLTPGPHHIDVRAAGYLPLVVDVTIQAHHKTEYRGVLRQREQE